MAALCTGNYGLSQNCTDNSKEYFFVKLTDSAYRAIEQYQKNQNKCSSHATIQIIGNGGIFTFPSVGGNGQQFSFSIDEIEGSFECIQQTRNQLNVLGALPYKMRVHANDDVYETTRHRMAVAEENQKNKCTREIKPNQTDIGRKVKLKNSSNRLANIPIKRDQLLTNASHTQLLSSNSSSNTNSTNSVINGIAPLPSVPSGNNLLNSSSNGNSLANNSTFSSVSLINNVNNTTNNNNNQMTSVATGSSLKSSNSTSSTINNNLINNGTLMQLHQNQHPTTSSMNFTSASSLSSVLSSAAGSGTSGINNVYYSNSNSSGNIRPGFGHNGSSSDGTNRREFSVGNSNLRNQKNVNRHMPDITRRKIRERLIHLLALKPFKKPELYARLQNEGIREKEKNSISSLLKEISSMRDNTYNLKRQIWNDVNEDWPFYTEQEIQMLKRRKPQNLTPPSDGGSSTSGQSPTSTHNGSPPQAVKRPKNNDRDRYYEEPIVKKQRISHFRKDNNEILSSSVNCKPQHESEDNGISISYSVLGTDAARRIAQKEEKIVNGNNNMNNTHYHSNITSKISNNLINTNGSHQSPSNYNDYSGNHCINGSNTTSTGSSGNHGGGFININNNNNNNLTSEVTSNIESCHSNTLSLSPTLANCNTTPALKTQTISSLSNVGSGISNYSAGVLERETAMKNHNNKRSNQNHQGTNNNNNVNSSVGTISNNSYDFSRFTKIKSIEQRRLYKTEFENDYDEYRELLNKIESVGKRFNVLAERLGNARNNDDNYRVIRKQILSEYEMIKREQEHERAKQRFDYLHAKLTHIKSLVSEFDKTLTGSNEETLSTAHIEKTMASTIKSNGKTTLSPGTNSNLSNDSDIINRKSSPTVKNSPINGRVSINYSSSSSTSSFHNLPKQENY